MLVFVGMGVCWDVIMGKMSEGVAFMAQEGSGGWWEKGRGIDSRGKVVGPVRWQCAAILSKLDTLLKTAEYIYSVKHDPHSNNSKNISGIIDWGTFVAVAKIGKDFYEVVVALRTIDSDSRSQIYAISVTKKRLTTPAKMDDLI